jgi:pimeloyl-ACP methyl ester carboxylesterase
VRPDGRVEWKHHFAHLANAMAAAPEASPAGAARPDAVGAVLGESGWEDLAAVTAPTTLIRGERGYVTDADAEDFARRNAEASVVTVSAGHNVQEDIPIELGERLRTLALAE